MTTPLPRRARHLLWAAPVALLLAAGIPLALAEPTQDKSELQKHMAKNQKAFLRIRKWSKDPKLNVKTLAQVSVLQQELLHAKSLVPKRAKGLGDKEKKAFILAYRKGIIKMINLTLKLETHLLEGKDKLVQKAVKELLEHLRKSHEKFKKED